MIETKIERKTSVGVSLENFRRGQPWFSVFIDVELDFPIESGWGDQRKRQGKKLYQKLKQKLLKTENQDWPQLCSDPNSVLSVNFFF